ncbi:hypothetical protein BGX29_010274 [Mortierella sp. GBA35]|nr:hypothetical protein BGX29_010274 [Mortierella sp. GBA35]
METLPRMERLRTISMVVTNQNQLQFLEIVKGSDHLPAIKVLVLEVFAADVQLWLEHQRSVKEILKTCASLTKFEIKGIFIDPLMVFAQAGGDDGDSWRCAQLRELWLEVSMPILSNSTHNGRPNAIVWKSIYRQLGVLTCLESLTLRSPRIDRTANAGLSQLQGIPRLQKHVLMNMNGTPWTRQQIHDLLLMAPHLSSLRLNPLSMDDKDQVKSFLRQEGRADLVF